MNAPLKKQNILVIRSAARVISQTLHSLKAEFPDSQITVLAPESIVESVALDPLIDEVLPFRDQKRTTVFNYGRKNIRELKNRNFDMAVSLYNIDRGMGYSNVDMLAWASGAKTLRGYNSKGAFKKLTGTEILKKSLLEKTGFIWSTLNMLATVVLFALITLGLIGEWCFRKLFTKNQHPSTDFSHARTFKLEEKSCTALEEKSCTALGEKSCTVPEPQKELTGV